MGKTTKTRDAALKAKIAFEAAKGEKTISQLASDYGVHPNQIGQWKKKPAKPRHRYKHGRQGEGI
jgi:putative transposase